MLLNTTIGILGCGWLGTPLALNLLKEGYTIKGTTSTNSKLTTLAALGILPFEITLTETKVEGPIASFLSDLDTLLINVPPRLRHEPNGSFVKRIESLLPHLENTQPKNVIFVSSTSVYGAVEGEITEATIPKPTSASGRQLLEIEQLLLTTSNFNTTVIRFGGLIGADRHPINSLAGRTLSNGKELVNLIHLDDCILMIGTILKKGYWNTIFNGVFPYHPTKKEYYTAEAKKRGLRPPIFELEANKIYKKTIKSHNFYVKSHQFLTTIVS